jgi:hypothetical protein
VKSKYLLHPIQTAKRAKALFTTRLGMWKFAKHGELRFKGDHRYDLQNVTDGFASRIDTTDDDTELLERICAAYSKAIERQQSAPGAYRPTDWWQQVRQQSLGSVVQALLTRDIPALRTMYRNFFRNSCSAGLLGAPFPNLEFLLYGEEELTSQAIARVDVVLMPAFEIAAMPAASIDVSFSSDGMSALSVEALKAYLKDIDRMTCDSFFCIGKKPTSESISELIAREHTSFQLAETRSSGWHSHRISGAGVGGAAGLAASTIFEQRYRRLPSHEPLQEVALAVQSRTQA